jgi:hypothetical protein
VAWNQGDSAELKIRRQPFQPPAQTGAVMH